LSSAFSGQIPEIVAFVIALQCPCLNSMTVRRHNSLCVLPQSSGEMIGRALSRHGSSNEFVLAGGKRSGMGQYNAFVQLGGLTLLAHVLELSRAAQAQGAHLS
jgi:hypothetical protein